MSLSRFFSRKPAPALQSGDAAYISPVHGALVPEGASAALWAMVLMLAVIATGVLWAGMAQVDLVTKANARVVPDGREQVIASLEGGILRELLVIEGQLVVEGQALALLDPTRVEAQQAEGQARRLALRGAVARLQAESSGSALRFPPELDGAEQVTEGETVSFGARARSLSEGVESTRRSVALVQRELAMAESMSAKGLMSEVEVMRLRRQVNDLNLQNQERINRFRQEASAELVRVRTELSQLEEQMVVRDDALRRSTLTSPVRGMVKQIRSNTVGGVVTAGSPIMEIVQLGPRVLLEARIRPADIGFIKVGQDVQIKLSAYEYTVFGGLKGVVQSISPDALGDPDRATAPDGTWYRALVRAESATLQSGDKALAVLPGMTASVEILTGRRTVLSYLLRPMLKSQEAFRER